MVSGPSCWRTASRTDVMATSVRQQLCRDFPAVLRKLAHHFLVQPDVHRCRVVRVAGVAEIGGQLLALAKTAVHAEKLEQVDDGVLPVELLRMFRGQTIEARRNVPGRGRAARARGGALATAQRHSA